jgi:hypothetical protein
MKIFKFDLVYGDHCIAGVVFGYTKKDALNTIGSTEDTDLSTWTELIWELNEDGEGELDMTTPYTYLIEEVALEAGSIFTYKGSDLDGGFFVLEK